MDPRSSCRLRRGPQHPSTTRATFVWQIKSKWDENVVTACTTYQADMNTMLTFANGRSNQAEINFATNTLTSFDAMVNGSRSPCTQTASPRRRTHSHRLLTDSTRQHDAATSIITSRPILRAVAIPLRSARA